MDDLRNSAALPCWDEEATVGTYAIPLPPTTPKVQKLWDDIPAEQLFFVGSFTCATSPQAHIGPFRWAVDFLVPDGTAVLAAEDGVVIKVKEDSDRWGNDPEFRGHLNYITVQHANGEFSQYCHLAKGSVTASGIRKDSLVEKGQRIATVGKSGWMDRDHLHFAVFRRDGDKGNPFGFKSLRVRFAPTTAGE